MSDDWTTVMRQWLYDLAFTCYRRAPFDSRRANAWWWLSCRIEHREADAITREADDAR